jgi:hypothetical protein
VEHPVERDDALRGHPQDERYARGYFGPGSECNVYEFLVYALAVPTFSPTMATDQAAVRTQLLALDDQILGTASVRARQDFNGTCNP